MRILLLLAIVCTLSCFFNAEQADKNQSVAVDTQKTTQPIIVCPDSAYEDLAEIKDKNCVKSISLVEKGYTSIPSEIFEMVNIERLDLTLNKIDSIPDEIGRLVNLRVILMPECGLKYVSPEIKKVTKLKYIDFLFNKFTHFPEVFCEMDSIKYLNFTGNPINEVPECVLNMPSLQIISIEEEEPKSSKYIPKLKNIKDRFAGRCIFKY